MTVIELLELLNEQGISLSADGDQLRINAPKGALTAELRQQLSANKAELISLLSDTLNADDAESLPDFLANNPTETQELSFAQERLWFLDQLEPGNPLYNVPTAIKLVGPLQIPALEKAIDRLAQRHSVLRTSFAVREEDPQAIEHTDLPVNLKQIDARKLGNSEVGRLLSKLNSEPFDLGKGPLMRACLLHTAASEFILLLVVHHIATDGASMGVLMSELAQLYGMEAGLTEKSLNALPIKYSDFARWQRATLQGEQLEHHLNYWRRQLADAPLQLELSGDHLRPAVPSYSGAWATSVLPLRLLEKLRKLARRENTTLYSVLLAGFNILLHRYTRQDDLLVGTPVGGRQQSETERLVGLFVNSVVIRSRINDDASFLDFLAATSDTSLEALSHQDLPFERLVEELHPDRNSGTAPLFQVMFNLQNREQETVPFAGLKVGPVIVETGQSKFDLSVLVEDREDGLATWFEYSTELFDRSTIERMVGHYGRLLSVIATQPESRVGDLSLMGSTEKELLLREWNRTQVAYPADATLVSLFEAQVARTPDAVAIRFESKTLTYAQLNARANKLANFLMSSGIGREHLVGVCMERSVDMVVALYGALKCGAAYVPLDPDNPTPRLQHMLQDAGVGVLLSHSALADRLPQDEARIVNLNIGWDAITINSGADTNPGQEIETDQAAYVIFTSGSTGKPKGVLNEHRGIVNRLLWMQDEYGMNEQDKVLQKTPFSFDVSVWEFFWPLQNGAELVIAKPDGHRDSDYLIELIRETGITTIHFVPSMLRSFLQNPQASTCTSLKRVICSGEALPADLQEQFFATLDADLYNLYGPTEAAIDVTHWTCRSDDTSRTVPIGRPVANTQIYIVDPADEPVPIGLPGELLIGGIQVARGYVNRPELSAERFTANPFTEEAGARVYRTGDLARFRPNGVIEFLGRIDFQVKLRGFRIELGEIEAALLACSNVKEAAVVLREDQPGDQRLVAYVALSASTELDTETLRHELAENLPQYMLPAAFVEMATLPTTANGKLDRAALPAPEWGTASKEEFVKARNPLEDALCEIWSGLLQVESVGVNDDFFVLGGHSLLATRLMARIRERLNTNLPLKTLFDHPTVAELAAQIDPEAAASAVDAETGSASSIEPRSESGPAPLSASQQRLWVLDQLDPGNPVYNIPWAVRVRGTLNLDALQTAINKLVERQSALRTRFISEGGKPFQVCESDVHIQLNELDFSQQDTLALAQELTRLSQHSFELPKGPLICFNLLHTDDGSDLLHIVMHHIIGDAWSTDILMQELGALYQAVTEDREPQLPPLPIDFIDYAVWQAGQLERPEMAAALEVMRSRLADAPAVLPLPTDRPRPAVQSYNGAWHELILSAELSEKLKALSSQNNATLFMVLFAAFNVLLRRYSGQDDLVVGTPIAGRQHTVLENIVGMFINTLALRTRIDGQQSFTQLLAQVRDAAFEAFENQEVPFERLVDALDPVRDTSYAPVFQVMFILQNTPSQSAFVNLPEADTVLFDFGTAKLDLTLSMEEAGGQLRAYFEYNTDLFDEETIERMSLHFNRLLEAVVADASSAVDDLTLLEDSERTQLLHDWNATNTPFPHTQTLHGLFAGLAAENPDSTAIECGDEALSYAELEQRANAVAAELSAMGAGPDVVVGLCMQRGVDLLVGLLAILKSGSAYLPLDPDFPSDRLRYMLEDSGAPVLLGEQALMHVADGLDVKTLCVADVKSTAPNAPENRASATSLAYVIYTSGSTGKPKGVAVEHRAAVNFLTSMQRAPGIRATERLLAVTTLSFDISILEILGPLLTGATVVLATRAVATDGPALARMLDDANITMMQATPATWRMLLAAGWAGNKNLKVLCGGEALAPELATELATCSKSLWNMYGPTETTIWSACEHLHSPDGLITVGRPIANTQCYILDAQRNPLPVGVAGELYIGGIGLARGYLNQPSLSAEKFIHNPYVEATAIDVAPRMYGTGDLARFLPDGRIEVLGRTDFQIKLRGFRIEPGEIETAVAQLDGVGQCVVVLREDSPGDQRLVAYFTPTDGPDSAPDTAQLRSALKTSLPEYMVPATFVALEAFPMTANNKVDRKQLPAPDWEAAEEYVAPRNTIEDSLAAIWRDVLGVEQIGIQDDFFALGGHSLTATQLIARIYTELGIEIPLMTLFNAPTIGELTAELGLLEPGSATGEIVRVERDGPLQLSFAQQRLWFLDELSPGNPMYNIPWVMALDGEVHQDHLQAAINHVVARHESLRSVFSSIDGEATQIILPELNMPLAVEDARQLDESALQNRITNLAQQPMNLESGPLAYFTLLQTDDDRALFSIVIHHIVFDAWSHGLLLNELADFYNAALAGQTTTPAPLTIDFVDYAAWQRQWFGSEDFQQQLNYWTDKLAGAPGILELPTDKPRPAVQTSNGANISRMLPAALHDGVKDLAEQEGVSLFIALLTTFNLLMARYSGQDDILVGTPLSGRKRSELEKIIGFFLHTLVIRSQTGGDINFRELLEQTRQTVLEAFAHQEMPFETLVEALDPERDTSRHPLFQVHFVLQHVDIDWQMFDGITASPVEFEFGTAKFDIMFFVFEANGSLSVRLEYNTDLFEAATIERMIDHFEVLLAAILRRPEAKIAELPLISAAEQQTLTHDLNATEVNYPGNATLQNLLEKQVSATPDNVAVQFEEQQLAYAELNRRANQLAHWLIDKGLTPDDCVGVHMERSVEMVVALLGIIKAGGAYVPLDPDYPQHRLSNILDDASVGIVLTHGQVSDSLPDGVRQLLNMDTAAAELAALPDSNPEQRAQANNLAYVIFTSGSTGRPKGVMNEHGGICNRLLWMQDKYGLNEQDKVLQKTPFSFDVSVWEFFWPLMTGATLVVARPDGHRDSEYLCELIQTRGITTLHFVPSMLQAFLQNERAAQCASLQRVICSGEALSTGLQQRFFASYADTELHNLYGPTEAAIDVTYWHCERDSEDQRVPIGRPVANTNLYIVDRNGQLVPQGVAGELYIGGIQVARGYANQPALTAERFVPDSFGKDQTSEARLYRTGDLVRYRNDGAIEFLGRIDHQVKLRGFRIELGEIETLIANHPAVDNTVVVAREDGEDDKRLVAYVVANAENLAGADLAKWEAEQVGQWQELWQNTYASDTQVDNPAEDFYSWNSSYDGEPIPVAEMRSWLDNAAANIRSLQPKRVLEVGSGSGLIVGRIAPHVDSYTATDFSAASINRLEQLAEHLRLDNFTTRQASADQLKDIADQAFDTVVLNSVAQYFPDIQYLQAFLRDAIQQLAGGGHIYLGDIRSRLLLEAYHTSVQLHQADGTLEATELGSLIRQAALQEEELLVDPAFFSALQSEWPEITGVRFWLKQDTHRNELSKFRYDVALEINGTAPTASPTKVDWQQNKLDMSGLEQQLQQLAAGDALLVQSIPDARLSGERAVMELLDGGEANNVQTLRDAAAAASSNHAGIEVAELYALAERLNLDLQMSGTKPGQFVALFSASATPSFAGAALQTAIRPTLREYANDPLHGKLNRILVPELREQLAAELPEYMLPSAFVIMDAFPLTSSGKIDRKALPAPDRKRSDETAFVAPRGATESTLAKIWSQILGIENIGVDDNFFALGGHSLLATQLVSRIRDQLQTELPLMALFNQPTIAGLAAEIAATQPVKSVSVIPRVERGDELPLSFAQQRLWFLHQLEGVSATYNVPVALQLHGKLNIKAMQKAVNDLVDRHESLRTKFVANDGKPAQVILKQQKVPIDVIKLKKAADEVVQAKLEQLAQTPFDLANDALLRVHVIRTHADHNLLLLVMHHIVSDGWSLGVLTRELAELYEGHCNKTQIELAPLAIQYADYAVWQREWLSPRDPHDDAGEHNELERQLAYWRDSLRGAPELLALPTDLPRQSVQTFNGAHINRTLPAELGEQLRTLARGEDATLFMLLLTAYNILLSRYSGSTDIVVGSPIAGRTRTETENLIGFFVNTLVMRTDLSGEPDFLTALRRVRKTALGAYAHQELPFEKLVEELQPNRDTSHPPIFQTLFVLQENLSDNISFHELEVTPLDFELGSAKFDLSLFMVEFPEGLTASFEYNTDLFSRSTVERMLGQLETLLQAIVATPTRAIDALPLLPGKEREQVLQIFNQTAAELPHATVHALVEAQADRTPAALALEFGEEQLSYAELNTRANRLAHHLIELGVEANSLVGLCAERSVDTLVSLLAILKTGAAYVPIDPNYPAERVEFMLADSRAGLVISSSDIAAKLGECKSEIVLLDRFDWESGQTANPSVENAESVYVIYTSGSTGKPKGVELSHTGLNNLLQWQSRQPGLDKAARTLQFASLSFDVSFQELFSTWSAGGTVVLIDDFLRRDIPALSHFIAYAEIERLYLPFAALQPLAASIAADANLNFALQDVIVAGEQLQITPVIRSMFERLPATRLHNHYGPSETHVVTAYTLPDDIAAWGALPPIGTPVSNCRTYILDNKQQPCPIGVPGELYLAGAQVSRGYIHRPELSAERFLPDPYTEMFGGEATARMYKTGDRARFLADGNIEYLGRTDDQLKWRGFRIEPGEIEAALAEHPSLSQAAVLLREDDPGDPRLVAYVVAHDGAGLDTEALRSWARQKLPDYMLPSAFVWLDALPLTPSGKIARRELPVPDYAATGRQFIAPRSPIEESLVQIWCDILKLEQVSIHDDFFELGGHSLLATQLISRVRDVLDVELPLISLFNNPSVAEFAADVGNARGDALPPSIQVCDRGNTLPLSFAQQRMWFLDQLEPGDPVYNIPWAMQLDGPLNIDALQQSIDALVARHESLRTVFESTLGKAEQKILPSVQVTIDESDAFGDDLQATEAKLNELARIPFHLETGPLLRTHVIHIGPDRSVLLLVLHHIIADGWSISVLYAELVRLYGGFCQGATASLPPLRVQYADFAVWQQGWIDSDAQQQQLSYWRQQLAGAPALLELPTDHPRGATQSYNGGFIARFLPAELHTGLKDLARSEKATLFMVGLTAFNILLSRYSGQTDICVGTPLAGRRQSDLENLIGFFVNTLVLRNEVSSDRNFAEQLQQVKASTLDAFANQELPFETLVDELQPVRDMSHAPLFQVAFIMQNTPWDQSATLQDLHIEPIELDYGVAKFDLSLVMAERREGLLLHFEYNSDLFDRPTINRMVKHFETLLAAIVANPQQAAATLPLLTADEREEILYDWNTTDVPFADHSCLHQLFEERVAQQPDATAVYFEDRKLSYAELNDRANQLAHFLIARGADANTIVGLSIERSPELVVGLLGILKSGAAYVPLDPDYPNERLKWMLEDSGAKLILTQSSLLEELPIANIQALCIDTAWPEIQGESVNNPQNRATADDLVYVIYTSGSTGKPKGVMIEHRGACNLADAQARTFGLGPEDRMLQFASISFDASIFELIMGLHVGAAMVLAPRDELLPGDTLLNVLQRHEVSAVTLPPTALAALPVSELPHLHTITVAGEACPPELVQSWCQGRRFFNLYGPTESTVWASYKECLPDDRITIGKPITNARLYVLDEHQQPLPVGVPGELCIGGAGLARGYLNQPDLSKARFLPDPFRQDNEAGARIYRTGDRVKLRADGEVEFLGRIDHQVKIRGFRIELGEIEAALSEYADVQDVIVVDYGKHLLNKQLVAYIVPQAGIELSVAELRSHLKHTLPEYMIPASFVALDELPLTPNRKIDRAALPAPDTSRLTTGGEYVAPRTEAESILAGIWQDVLNVEQVSTQDNFFELGGDSILSIQIIARAAQQHIKLTPRQLFQHQTVTELAAVADIVSQDAADQELVTGPVALSPIQSWLREQNPAQLHHFNQSQLFDCGLDLDVGLLDRAFCMVADHHDTLRMRLNIDNGEWQLQQNGTAEGGFVRIVNLEKLDRSDRRKHELALADAMQASINLSNGPILRALIFHQGGGLPDQLFIAIHHLAVDWVSWSILLEDLQTAYLSVLSDEPLHLPLKTTSFKAWSEKLQDYANSPALETELAWWKDRNWSGAREIPTDYKTGTNLVASAADCSIWLSESETALLQTELPKLWRTRINDALLTAVANALTQWTDAPAALINLEGHGREDLFDDVDLSRTVGWFTSLYPLLLNLPTDSNPGVTLKAVKEQLRSVPNNGVGYGVLRYLATAESRHEVFKDIPEPQVGFNYLGQLDAVTAGDSIFTPSANPRGDDQSKQAERTHLLDVAMAITGGQLQISVRYSKNRHKAKTVEKFTAAIAAELRKLTDYCGRAAAAVYTPSDFPRAQIDQASLDNLIENTGAIEDICKVTSLQHGMLFHSLFSSELDIYFARFRWRLSGQLDVDAFEAAWQQVVDRNMSLRSSFQWDGVPEPVQIIHSDVKIDIHRENWSDVPATEIEQRFSEFLAADQAQRFDFAQPPLMRLNLLSLSPVDHHLVWSFHHSILDGWSVPLVVKEVFAIYEAAIAERELVLPAPLPFSRYLDWLAQRDVAGAEQFWRQELAGVTGPTPLPAARVQKVSLTAAPEYEELLLQIDADTVTQLRNVAKSSRLTLNTIVQGVWGILLSRYSGEDDVVFGATTSGRPADIPGVANMIGLFLNTVPVRIGVDASRPLLDWLRELQGKQLEARSYEFASLVEVQGWSSVPRGTPMFGSLLAFENYPDMDTMWTSTQTINIGEVEGYDRTNFPLTLNVAVFDILQLRVVYDARMFERDAVEKLTSHFQTLLEGIGGAQPNTTVGALSILSDRERQQLSDWNRSETIYPLDASMHAEIVAQAAEFPNDIAVECGAEKLTYSELDRRSNQLALRLIQSGAGKDVPVGVCLERSADMLVALLGILKSGSAYLPLDPGFPIDRLGYMLDDSEAPVLITEQDQPNISADLDIEVLYLSEIAAELDAFGEAIPEVAIDSQQLAYLIYTSGSTGLPKGVAIEHRAAVNFLHSMVLEPGLVKSDRLLAVTTLSFDISILEVFAPLYVGATVVVATQKTLKDGFALAQTLGDSNITIMQATPSTWRLLLQAGWEPSENLTVLCGGEALDLELARQLALPDSPVWNMYGPTETTIWSACELIEYDVGRVTVGSPIANTQLYVLDEQMRRVPPGIAGELYIGGDGVARGYHKRPELTAEKFVDNPFRTDSGRIYRTGDLARFLPDGRLEILGRTDYQVKLRGYRIELGEIETLLSGVDNVTQAVVVLREDTPGDQRLVGYLTASTELDYAEISIYLHSLLPDYMVPAAYVTLEEFPLTPNGKVDRKQLPAPEWSSEKEYVAPRNEVEESLAGIWQDILSVEQVGIHDDFFALGGHSLIAMKLVSRIMERLQVQVPLEQLFEAPTIAGLSTTVKNSRESGATATEIAPIARRTRHKKRRTRDNDKAE